MKNNIHFKGIIEEKEVINLLGDLISINSVNPLEDTSAKGEKELASYVRGYLKNIGVKSILHSVLNERPNIMGIIEGKNKGKNLVLEAHMDTVKADNMTIDPFLPKIKEGKMFGRGACDDKGSLASMLLAIKLLKQKGILLNGNVYLAAVVDEEHKQRGVSNLLNQEFRFDAAIVGEPTNLDIIIAHQGCLRWKILTKGISAHSSEPEKGENAIYFMSEVINVLQKRLIPLCKEKSHPLVGSPTLSVNIIQGGTQINTIPNRCFIEIDRRMIPGENNQDILKEVDKFLNKLKKENPLLELEREDPFIINPPMQINRDEEVVQALFKCIKDNRATEPKIRGVKFGTDAAIFVAQGIPAAVFGPGNIAQAHSEDEWVEIKQVAQAAEIIAQTIIVYQNEGI
jgi:acetylornithine deacetylase/succinyl-diaminopimelate desuccinylase family protein